MNRFSLAELKNITNIIKTKNVENTDIFDYLRIVDLNKTKYEKKANNTLFFLSYPKSEEIKDGWYINDFDLRPHFEEIYNKFPQYTFVIEKNQENIVKDNNVKYIVVDNIRNMINDIYKCVLKNSKAKVISFTGSVGKTTAVGLLENILKQKYCCFRIYSKRITPIILQANIINFLNPSIDFILLENSLYYHNHVKVLSTLLKPDIVAILNIESSHQGIEKLKTLDDICMYKADIMRNAKIAYINEDNNYLKRLKLKNTVITYKNKPLFTNKNLTINNINSQHTKIKNDTLVVDNKIIIKPFVLSELSIIQCLTCYNISKYLGLSDKEIIYGIDTYKPVENRLRKEIVYGKEIIFDGDITTYEHMNELSNIIGNEKYLVLRKVGSSENTFRIDKITNFFNRFKKVFIFADIAYLDKLKNEENVVIVTNHNFIKKLNGIIIYHYSGYYRVWDNFNQKNLNIYDNEKYVIKK